MERMKEKFSKNNSTSIDTDNNGNREIEFKIYESIEEMEKEINEIKKEDALNDKEEINQTQEQGIESKYAKEKHSGQELIKKKAHQEKIDIKTLILEETSHNEENYWLAESINKIREKYGRMSRNSWEVITKKYTEYY
ncbi:hypothetical protein ENBRE01_2807 [Enteropsectra breve]|nr:hypothetical protein ENBRE01_2807 [Enteropsectra breve]